MVSDPDVPVELLRLTVLAVRGRWDALRSLRAGQAQAPGRPWREALLQAHLFAGFPRIVEAFGVLEEVGGLGAPEPEEVLAEPDLPERGQALFEAVYGPRAEAVSARLRSHHPDFAHWVLGHAYGRVLTRPGLTAAQREVLAVVALAALGQDRQLAGHARGAVAVGAAPQALHGALAAVADAIEPDDLERARRVLMRFAPLPAAPHG
jgi:4-carboxymuconolactone decarboxylase